MVPPSNSSAATSEEATPEEARKVSDLEAALVTAEQAGDGGKVSFLRTQLEQLCKEKVALREEKNLLLRAQQGGGHCSLLPPSAHSCYLTIGSILLLTS